MTAIAATKPAQFPDLGREFVEHAPFPIVSVEGKCHIVRYVNLAFCQLVGKSPEQLVGFPFCKGLPETDLFVGLLDRVFRTGKAECHTEQDRSISHPGLWSFTMWPVISDGSPVGVMLEVTETAQHHARTLAMNEALMLGSLRQHELTEIANSLNVELTKEISDRKYAEERVKLLMGELAHRGQNQLAVLQSIASRSLTGNRPLAEAREVLMQRLYALGRTQTTLVRGGFDGVPLRVIIGLEFEAFSARVEAVGPDLMLAPKVAQTFALILHELATNASKYGALSADSGVVYIEWSINGTGADLRFRFRWQESGGPPVTPPTREGFGRTVLERAVAQEFGSPPKITFAPAGLLYEIEAPLSAVMAVAGGGAAEESQAAPGSSPWAAGLRSI